MSERFFRSSRPGYPHPVCSQLEIVVSEWRSVIAVSLNVGGGFRLIKPAKLHVHANTLQTRRGRTHGAGCARPCFRTAEALGERRYENWITHISDYYLNQPNIIIIGIKHGFPCINVCQVPREMLKTEAKGRGFLQFPRNLANVNALENNV